MWRRRSANAHVSRGGRKLVESKIRVPLRAVATRCLDRDAAVFCLLEGVCSGDGDVRARLLSGLDLAVARKLLLLLGALLHHLAPGRRADLNLAEAGVVVGEHAALHAADALRRSVGFIFGVIVGWVALL